MAANPSERLLITCMAGIQFINIVEFMMVMPLGAELSEALHIPTSHIGYISGSYTAAEAVASIIMAFFLDRFDRRTALMISISGFIMGTLSCTFATDLNSMIFARVISGFFAGPLAALSVAIIIDRIPFERRGKALGVVMSAFSISSIFGVPIGLELAKIGGWQFPFFVIATVSLSMLIIMLWVLPPMRAHLAHVRPSFRKLLRLWIQPKALTAYILTVCALITAFSLVPNISAYVQYNLHYPREDLGFLYLAGGITSFFMMRIAGRSVDRFGNLPVAIFSTALMFGAIYVNFVNYPVGMPVVMISILLMGSNAVRAVAMTNSVSQVPSPAERAGFMSMHGAMQCIGSTLGSISSTFLLQTQPNGALIGMDKVGMIAMGFSLVFPVAVWWLHRLIHHERIAAAAMAALTPVPAVVEEN
jgi:predicted MFS family arabinose efflux permease